MTNQRQCYPCIYEGESFEELNVNQIIDKCLDLLGIEEKDFFNSSKGKRPVYEARHIIISILKEKKISEKDIAFAIRRDRTTAYNSTSTLKNLCKTDKDFNKQYTHLKRLFIHT